MPSLKSSDIRGLFELLNEELRHLDIRSKKQAATTITKYYPLERFPQKTLCALEELLPE